MHQLIMKADLKAIGFTDFQASQIIRIIKYRLNQAGIPFYANPKIRFVPAMEVARYLFGVADDPEDPVAEFRKRLTNLSELAEALHSREIAQQIIREAQQTMVEKGCPAYQNVRHWIVPLAAVEQILFRNQKEEV
ncbi:DUF3173 domain-containing protein [Sporolactobacillus shoreae]|uniref:DUF3173 domain-containing protein n=1 Tax=Sporolactobacillus shoreae TaxID=1465501 RepID=A0A4Z0GMI1_9BACL|nr:DUF3173 family protein [Sporolactobacillus shoreae]TGA97491.1 DUF3173 domain-containing protein [Sporolactobacillus shoreae]